jgi:mono/diheme cytochrome c family protein
MTHLLRIRLRAAKSGFASLAALSSLLLAGPAWAQMVNSANTIRRGHDLASIACANCHQVAVDQRPARVLAAPAPSFDSIAQRPDINADVLQHLITSTRRNVEHPAGMPNPYLLEYQVQQVVTYILSLRK